MRISRFRWKGVDGEDFDEFRSSVILITLLSRKSGNVRGRSPLQVTHLKRQVAAL